MGEVSEKEMRVYGPPGTGKTTYMTGQIKRASEKFGDDRVLVASFTRTAAQELAGRGTGLDKRAINTLHGHAFSVIGKREIAEEKASEFNEFAPHFAISKGGQDVEDMAGLSENTAKSVGDDLFSELQVLRAKMVDPLDYPIKVRDFSEKWEEWKHENGYIDFTDMIELALERGYPPFEADIGFFDECQDFTPLEMALVRKWGEYMNYYILAMDDDQAIYNFKGSDAESIISKELPEENIKILDQSWRVPRKVQLYAEKIIEKVNVRAEKIYKHKANAEGVLRHLPTANFNHPQHIIEDMREFLKGTNDKGEPNTVMILGSCSYMLDKVRNHLRAEGIPFHNPYRAKRGDWNPLNSARGKKTAVNRLLSYLRPSNEVYGKLAGMWRFDDVPMWVEHLTSKGILKRGAKKTIAETYEGTDDVRIEDLMEHFEDEALMELLGGEGQDHLIKWWMNHVMATHKSKYDFPIKILESQGLQGIMNPPQVVIGSIHSVKGGQADRVYIFPDISQAAAEQYQKKTERDAIIRLFYVAVTRAANELVICNGATGNLFKFPNPKTIK